MSLLFAVNTLGFNTVSFKNEIPRNYTLYGQNQVPEFTWSNLPPSTKSLVLIMDDPDAPTQEPWVHWVVYNIPPSIHSLPILDRQKELPNGIRQGTNTFGRIGYDGPKPPAGKPHRYYFKLYALDIQLSLAAGATKNDLLKAMEGHILAMEDIIGTFEQM